MGDEMLAKVCELAFEVAKEGDAPSAMKNYLYLAHRPPRAYSVAQRALEEDSGFRARVADRATIENVGEDGYLWLQRPDGWERRMAALDAGIGPTDASAPAPMDRPPMPEPPSFTAPVDPTPAPTVDSIEVELSSLRNLVDRLADERQNVRSSVSELEEELETRRAENLAMSTHLSALRTELSAVQATEDSVAAQRDAALRRVAELESRIAELESGTEALEESVGALTGDVDRLRSDLVSVSAERDEAAAQLAEELAGSDRRIAELIEATEQLTEDNTELASRVVVAEQARMDLENQLDDVSGKWQEASRQLAALSGIDERLDAVVGERDQLGKQLIDAREQLARVRSAADTGHEQLSAALTEAERTVDPVDVPAVFEPEESAPGAEDRQLDDQPSDEDAAQDWVLDTDLDTEDEAETDVETDDEADVADDVINESDAPEIDIDDRSPSVESPPAGRMRISTPDHLTDEIDVARHIVSTPDVVLLIDGDGAAGLGWPHLDVAARRSALVNYLGQLTADMGAAADVVFERPVGGEEELPVSRAVRVRIADVPVADSPLFSAIVHGYPEEWPIVVVTDEAAIAERAEELEVTHLGNGQLLDLFLYLSSHES